MEKFQSSTCDKLMRRISGEIINKGGEILDNIMEDERILDYIIESEESQILYFI